MTIDLKKDLEELESELDRIRPEDSKLQQLSSEVKNAIAQPEEVSLTLHMSLQHVAEEFEAHHPELIALINNVMTSLSSLGI